MKKFFIALIATFSLSAVPKAVVFDFGGVLKQESARKIVVQFICDSFQCTELELETFHQMYSPLKTSTSEVDFWMSYAQEKGIPLPSDWPARFKAILKESIGVNPAMYDLIEELKQKNVQIGLLSNTTERRANLVREFGFYEPFAPCLLSHEIGANKPDMLAYQILLNTLTLPAQDVLFIDDKMENVRAAKDLGIDAILFQSEAQLRADLKKKGIL